MLHFPFTKQLLAASLVIVLVMPSVAVGQAAQQPDTQSAPAQEVQVAQSTQQTSPASNAAPVQPSSDPQQTSTANPVGTAAAPSEKPVGSTGSEPAGAAIAPAKQRRVRRILISVGAIIGAGIAVGTVAALSHSSPSRPH